MDKALAEEFCRELPELLGDWTERTNLAKVRLVSPGSGVPDATAQIALLDKVGRFVGFVLCSSPPAPEMVNRGVNGAALARSVLSPELGKVILEPLHRDRWRGLSFVLLPYCAPVDQKINRFGRWRLSHPLLKWLYEVVEHTLAEPGSTELENGFVRPLSYLLGSSDLAPIVGDEVTEVLARLESGKWNPKKVLMHGDLHLGNVLISPDSEEKSQRWQDRLVVIDWGGCDAGGVAVYDLVRLSASLMLGRRRMGKELRRHASLMNCDVQDLRSYLLAALGNLGLNLDHFPRDRYVRVIKSCMGAMPPRG